LIEALLAGTETADVMALPKTEEDRRLLASILMTEEEELTPETVEGAVRALRRIYLRRRLEEVQVALQRPGLPLGRDRRFCRRKCGLKRALMDPGLAEASSRGVLNWNETASGDHLNAASGISNRKKGLGRFRAIFGVLYF
jgi:hypothetical protein